MHLFRRMVRTTQTVPTRGASGIALTLVDLVGFHRRPQDRVSSRPKGLGARHRVGSNY
jgi:hypothetical protein